MITFSYTLAWNKEEGNLKTFLNYLNSLHPTIKFTHEYSISSLQSLPFLDVQVQLKDNQIQTDLYTKPTDKHQYFLKSSCHKSHIKRSIPFSLALRSRRICSTDFPFEKRFNRGYIRSFLKSEIRRVHFIPRCGLLTEPQQQKNSLRPNTFRNHLS